MTTYWDILDEFEGISFSTNEVRSAHSEAILAFPGGIYIDRKGHSLTAEAVVSMRGTFNRLTGRDVDPSIRRSIR